ncbi:type I 3-dehydroquinate dehydratase [Brachybacterium sp. FME24]|uniref:type I 3-dehydroquinate dehydratase n=1 Tax=Brachybacterium sp. FME24 TaxID=2742605 RepID=UPI001D016F2E|nr:type I 3-dehydroquinate dehydratase [Brachybacterium sp. FME24]
MTTESMPITATVRGIELGRARPEIIVPIMGDDQEAVLAQASAAAATSARIIEWRIDHFRPDVEDPEAHRELVLASLPALRAQLGPDRALLATVRTSAEGGARQIRDSDLAVLLEALIATRRAGSQSPIDLIDIETSRTPEIVARVMATAHRNGVVVVGSFHDFTSTPSEEELVELLRAQRRLGADVPKVAVTPSSARDVLALMSASLTVAAEGKGPHIAISMGSLGVVSRVAAETFGSAATFASVGKTSAPGQVEATEVSRMLELLRP